MSITNYLRACNKALWIFAGVLFLNSCKPSESEKENIQFLGSPKEAQLNIRFIPSDWISKQLFDSLPNHAQSVNNPLINSIVEDSPSLLAVSQNFLSLEADFSKNWILSTGVLGETKFVSFYFKGYRGDKIKTYLDKQNIASEVEFQGIKCIEVDKKSTHSDYILYDEDHILWMKVYGDAIDKNQLVENCIYPSKEEYVSFFDKLFTDHRNDLDIRLKSDSTISQYISEPLGRDILKQFDGFISLNLKEKQVSLEIENLNKDFVLDSIFQSFSPIEEKIVSFQTNLNLQKLQKLLIKYNFLDDVNYELKKAKLDFKQIEEFGLEAILLNYNGKIKKQNKSITYAFDEEFNEVEKVTYNTTESYDFEGFIYTRNIKNLITALLNKQYLSKVKNNQYEPILASNSVIKLDTNKLKIGDNLKFQDRKVKFILSINEPKKVLELVKKESLLEILPVQNARLEMDNANKIRLEINTFGEAYGYAKNLKEIMEPKTFGN